MNPLRRVLDAIDRWADTGVGREVEAAIGPYTQPPAAPPPARPGQTPERGDVPRACPAPGQRPGGREGSSPPPGGGTSGPPLPPGPVAVSYDVRFWSCGCTCMWDGRRQPVLRDWCAFHAHLRAWEEELSQ